MLATSFKRIFALTSIALISISQAFAAKPLIYPSTVSATQFQPPTQPFQNEVTSAVSLKGILVTAWVQFDLTGKTSCGISTSSNQGVSWSTANIQPSDYFYNVNPALAVDENGVIFAVCLSVNDYTSGGVLQLSKSFDDGHSWTAWKTIYEQLNGIPDKPWLQASNKKLRLVFTTETPKNLSIIPADSHKPQALVDRIFYADSSDQGSTWSAPVLISKDKNDIEYDFERFSVVGAQGSSILSDPLGNTFVTWAEYHNGKVKFRNISDIQSNEVEIADTGVQTPITQLIPGENQNEVLVVWYDAHVFGNIFFSLSKDNGKSWSQRKILSSSGTMPAIAKDGLGHIHAIYSERDPITSSMQTYYAKFDLTKTMFGPPLLLDRQDVTGQYLNIGAYQSISALPNGTLSAFWIKYGDADLHVMQTLIPI